jgi:hypothetical protein
MNNMTLTMEKLLTKTDFILYRDCSHNVWMKWHRPEEYSKFEISEFEKSLGVMGNEVELEARKLFPEGVLIDGRNIKYQERTRELIDKHELVIFQAVFATEKYLAAADILKWNDEAGAYDLYEVKMSSVDEDAESENNKLKKVDPKQEEQFEYDLAFQVNVMKMCGVNINKKYLLRINKDYVREGELNLEKLFEATDKTEIVGGEWEGVVLGEMETAYNFLSKEAEPKGPCGCYYKGRKRHCTSFGLINPLVPDYSVHDLHRIGNSKKLLAELLGEGLVSMDDLSEYDDRFAPKKPKMGEEPSKPKKLNQIKAHKSQASIVDIEAIRGELDSLVFPLYFLDYETFPTAIPPFDGYHPYQHIVFQYSLHILRSKDGELEHKECLVLDGDPAERIVASMREHIGDTGSVISWYKHFENSRNRELAHMLPHHADFLHSVINRTYDLMDIVDNQHYVHHGFKGSSSIKKVQQVLAPNFSYKELEVQNGTDAIEAYRQIHAGELVGEEAEEKKKQMLLYCKNDTEVMVIIWKFFADLVK